MIIRTLHIDRFGGLRDVTLNLNWYSRSDLRTVAYLPNGGKGSTTTQLAENGADVTVSENRFTRSKQASETNRLNTGCLPAGTRRLKETTAQHTSLEM